MLLRQHRRLRAILPGYGSKPLFPVPKLSRSRQPRFAQRWRTSEQQQVDARSRHAYSVTCYHTRHWLEKPSGVDSDHVTCSVFFQVKNILSCPRFVRRCLTARGDVTAAVRIRRRVRIQAV